MPYYSSLNGLRAVAVMLVLAFHCRLPLAHGGFIGVDVFFVLSGFLITGILRREIDETSRISFWHFYVRRAVRLWPALILMLVAYAALAPMLFNAQNVMRDVALSGLYLSDYSRALWGVPDLLSHTWSLSVEEHFYILWPFVIVLIGRRTGLEACLILGALFIAASFWRIVDAHLWQEWARTYYRFDTRLSGLVIGGVVAVLPWRPTGEAARVVGQMSFAALVFLGLAGSWGHPPSIMWMGVLVDLAAAGLVWSLACSHKTAIGAVLSWRPLVYLGVISYGVYLWHYPISRAVRDVFDPWTALLIVAPISVALASLSFEFVERPLKQWREQRLAAAGA